MHPGNLIDQTKTIVLLIGDGIIVYANAYAQSFYGYDNLVGLPVIGTIVPAMESSGRNLENLIENLENNPEESYLQINENITSRGDVVWIVWSNSRYIASSGVKMLLSVGIEATEVVKRSRKLEAIFNNSLDGIAMVSPELNIVECNSSFIEMIGFRSKKELLEIDRDENSEFRRYVKELSNELLDRLKGDYFVRVQREFQKYDRKSFVADAVYSAIRNFKGEAVGYVINLRDNTDMYRKATTDMLTQIYNKMHFEELAGHEINSSLRYGTRLSLILCDIDHFKKVNDTYGHLCGDFVLREIASKIKYILRDSDIFARVGGEEFAILLPATNGEAAYNVADKIRITIGESPFVYDGKEFGVTMSFGISEIETKIDRVISLKDLLELADKRLYYSKEHGRNRITCC